MTKEQRNREIKGWLLFAGLAVTLILTNVICAYL